MAPRSHAKNRVSLLFEQHDAGDVDSETVYNIGLNGFMELCQLDARFVPFEAALFGPSQGVFDRNLMGVDTQSSLNDSIAAFLRTLGPYLLLKPAHKVLEHLIRRYSIHHHNVDAVMECALPFHQTQLFGRLVSILVLENTKWAFLAPVQKSKTRSSTAVSGLASAI